MANYNRPVASSSTTTVTPSHKVRQLWKTFNEEVVPKSQNVLKHKISAAKVKADTEYNKMPNHTRISPSEQEQFKARITNKIREGHYENIKLQWANKLKNAGLKAEDWTDITTDEMEVVATTLGGGFDASSDEDVVVVNPIPQPTVPQTFASFFQRPIAPSFSTSTRTSNVSSISTVSTASSSSYAVVNPSEFHSGEEDDDLFYPTATSHDLTSDDDDGIPPPTTATTHRHRGHTFGGWSSGDSLASSLHNSVESLPAPVPIPAHHRPLVSNYILQNTSHTSLASNISHNNNHNNRAPADDDDDGAEASTSNVNRVKVRQPYIGPQLDDPDEPQAEADDFEFFKMQTRMQKIVEFHQQAALAEIRLSIEIYKERNSTSSGIDGQTQRKGETSSRVIEHQRRMTELQKTKEEERKASVKEERTKRRSELRGRGINGGRPGRSNTIVAPKPSAPTNPSWLTDFQEGLSPRLQESFDLERILASASAGGETGQEVEESVEQYLRNAMNLGSGDAPGSPSDGVNGIYGNGQGLAAPVPRWSTSSSSASLHSHHSHSSANTGNSFFSASSSQHSTRSTSKNANGKQKQKQKAKPSLFGADSDESSDEGDPDNSNFYDDPNENSPPADFRTQSYNPNPTHNPNMNANANTNPFAVRANVAVADAFLESQMQDDPLFAAALSRYSSTGNGNGISNVNLNSNSPPTPSWGTKPTATSKSSQNPWGATPMAMAKEVRATPVVPPAPAAGGWMRKKPASTNNNSNNVFASMLMHEDMETSPPLSQNGHSHMPFFSPEQFESPMDRLPSSMSSLNAHGQGRKLISTPMVQEAHSHPANTNVNAHWEMMAEQLLQQSQHQPVQQPQQASFMSSFGAKGKKPQQQQQQALSMTMLSQAPLELEESQAIWSQMMEQQNSKKQTPMPSGSSTSSGFFSSNNNLKPVPPTPVPPVIAATKPGKGVTPTPAPVAPIVPAPTPAAAPTAPAPATPVTPAAPPAAAQPAKKMNKKQRQAAKKNGGAAAAATEEPTPAVAPVEVAEPEAVQHALLDEPPATVQQQQPAVTETPSLISRMMPAIGRARRDSSAASIAASAVPSTPSGTSSASGPGLFGWDDSSAITTPRPASKVPAHLQHLQESSSGSGSGMGTPRPNNLFGKNGLTGAAARRMSIDQSGTIKSSQWGLGGSSSTATATNAKGSIWNVFGGGAKASTVASGESGMQIPGGFDMLKSEGSGGGGGDDDGGGGDGGDEEEEQVQTPQVWKASASAWGKKATEKEKAPTPAAQQQTKQPLLSAAAQRQRRMSEAAAASSTPSASSKVQAGKATPVIVAAAPATTQPQAIPIAQATGRKGAKAKKNAKGKKVTMEEVPDEENTDSKGGSLPVDHRALLLPANEPASPVILEPKPSVAPRMFDSIIGYGDGEGDDDEDEEGAFSSPHAATPSTAPSSPPDVFDARLIAAMKEMQEKNAMYSQRFDGVSSGGVGGLFGGAATGGAGVGGGASANGGAWAAAMAQQQHDRWVPSAMGSASTTVPKPSAWGTISKDKGKGKMTDVEDTPKNPLSLKRNKPAAGWL